MFPLATTSDGDDGTTSPLRVQVVVAHPDDETFGCGSVLLHAAAAGAVTGVVCGTRGEAGQVAEGVTVPAGGLAALREQELREAATLLGVSDVRLLGYLDSDMAGEPAPDTLCGAAFDDVVASVREAVTGFAPDVLVTLDGTDHRDHRRVREAAETVAAELGLPLYLVAIPRSLLLRWLEHTRAENPDSVYLDITEIGTPDEEVTHRFRTEEHYETRWRAMRAHRSQTGPFEGLPDELERAFLTEEFLVEVRRRG